MKKDKIVSEQVVYHSYLKVIEASVVTESEVGESQPFQRSAVVRPSAVAVLLYNSDEDEVIMVQQHRYPVKVQGIHDDYLLEIPAGKIDDGETPSEAAIREIKEETGYQIDADNLILSSEYYPSPGYSSELLYLYSTVVSNENKVSSGGGSDDNENIEIKNIKASVFFEMISSGEIVDGKTIMGANHFWHLRNGHLASLGAEYQRILNSQENK